MKLRTTLMAAPTAVTLVLLASLAAVLFSMELYAQRVTLTYESSASRYHALTSVGRQLSDANAGLYRTVAIIGSMSDDQVTATRSALSQLGKTSAAAMADALGQDTAELAEGKVFTDSLARFVKSADSALDLASVDPNTGVAAMQTADTEYNVMSAALAKLSERVQAQSQADINALHNSRVTQEVVISVLGLVACAGAFGFAWVMQRRIISDVSLAVDASNQVADGHFNVDVHHQRNDEIGQMLDALGRMTDQLSTSLRVVRGAAQNIENASSEIAAGNQDLSQRTEVTAANLQETAASMTQLSVTVQHTADSARSANELADSATAAARHGGKVMGQVISNMTEIDAASRKITEIISVIDGIAFQTNILALNAAVEAARAGEQGRGFAVVASEVRSLAQRSANAAREIKVLISTSGQRVELGARLVQEAGSSMQGIVDGVERVTQIIREITHAADQESHGISQVSVSVGMLDQMTQQNAALVEQSAAAAESLKGQAEALASVVSKFQLKA